MIPAPVLTTTRGYAIIAALALAACSGSDQISTSSTSTGTGGSGSTTSSTSTGSTTSTSTDTSGVGGGMSAVGTVNAAGVATSQHYRMVTVVEAVQNPPAAGGTNHRLRGGLAGQIGSPP